MPTKKRPRRNSTELKANKHARGASLLNMVRASVQLAVIGACAWIISGNTRASRDLLDRASSSREEVDETIALFNVLSRRTEELRLATSKAADRLDSIKAAQQKVSQHVGADGSPTDDGVGIGGRSSSLNLDETVARFRKAQEGLLPQSEQGNLVVILGVRFILERDFPIWDQTFQAANQRVVKTNKKKLAKGDHSGWKVGDANGD